MTDDERKRFDQLEPGDWIWWRGAVHDAAEVVQILRSEHGPIVWIRWQSPQFEADRTADLHWAPDYLVHVAEAPDG